MSRAVWKYPLNLTDHQQIRVPAGRALAVQLQAGRLCLWVEVTPGAGEDPWDIYIRGTGHDFDIVPGENYLGTIQTGPLVWHVYARRGEA